ncbi:ABC transporter ATP-binding protein [Thiomonas sp. FB-6]|uniref:ABC transporter ATP-binding protein n=1 Tax=Thiomonas sp. FB-6 TaxID=1158291 RepID=UPI0003630E76|nr:ABC transporter ATP-binding protein [Thiomonas sp. FB-6]
MLLELRGVQIRYGDMVVLPAIDLSVPQGQFLGVIGPNGAGKSSLFGAISGGLRCSAGTIHIEGRDMTRLSATQRCMSGVGRTFQIPQPFDGMSVFENILVAATYGGRSHGAQATSQATSVVRQCGLEPWADSMAGALTLLQRKRLELARAMAMRPRLLLLDEVAGGLTDSEVGELVQWIVQLQREGVTVLWIEHLVHALVGVVDRMLVLAEGRIIADGAPRTVLANPTVRSCYLGSDLDEDLGEETRDALH